MSDHHSYVFMGVSGSGKSTVGKLFSKVINAEFLDADDFHPKENVNKMKRGIPLNDQDRAGWLNKLNIALNEKRENDVVLACSALKESYREILLRAIPNNRYTLVYLKGEFEVIKRRLDQRKDHYMGSRLLTSQFETLEEPENALIRGIEDTPEEITAEIVDQLNLGSEIGVIGLGVMGKSLCRNLAQKGFKIAMYNRYMEGSEENIARDFRNQFMELSDASYFDELLPFALSLEKPRKILLMVNAGEPVDLVLQQILPFLDKNDILIDGGNSHYSDTVRRSKTLEKAGIRYLGCGISGGEEGALKGPSLMPGGSESAFQSVKIILDSIAAKDSEGRPCCQFIGTDGSGHYVKMVHNGIEYAEMQLLSECYALLKSRGLNPDEIADIFETWRKTGLDSYLLEITIQILHKKDGKDWLIDKILDKAGNKGTGFWTTAELAKLGVPATLISQALFARFFSSHKELRVQFSEQINKEDNPSISIPEEELRQAYKLARLVNHFQGFWLLHEASESYHWSLNLSDIARIWTGGCIIRSDLMMELTDVLTSGYRFLILPQYSKLIRSHLYALKNCCKAGIDAEVHLPCLNESLQTLLGLGSKELSANLLQAQRDFFGAHTYQLKNDPQQKYYHTKWQENE